MTRLALVSRPHPAFRLWALLQWLSAKLQQAPYEEILDAARQFEKYIVGDIEGRQVSEEAIDNSAKPDPAVSKIVTASAKEEEPSEYA